MYGKNLTGYPEWLDYSEDMYFHNKMKENKYVIKYEKTAMVRWYQRKDLKSIYIQFFRYMEGDGIAKMHTKRHLLRFIAYLMGIVLFVLGLKNVIFFLPLLILSLFYISVPYINFIHLNKYSILSRAIIMIPVLLIIADMGKMAGYISGLIRTIK